jgi:hypothetical protein
MGNIPLWLCIPFAGLLLCIAIFPLVKGEWWDKNKGWANGMHSQSGKLPIFLYLLIISVYFTPQPPKK